MIDITLLSSPSIYFLIWQCNYSEFLHEVSCQSLISTRYYQTAKYSSAEISTIQIYALFTFWPIMFKIVTFRSDRFSQEMSQPNFWRMDNFTLQTGLMSLLSTAVSQLYYHLLGKCLLEKTQKPCTTFANQNVLSVLVDKIFSDMVINFKPEME